KEGLWAIELAGSRVGEATGLLVIEEPGGSYGRPARITASAAPGREGVVSIEREVQLAGPLFGKAVLALAGYLRGRYAEVGPLSASIQIVFEQTSETIDGDSAGLAELLAALSALAGLPLRQDRAITGAVDQTGRVLPVGGITEKAEGLVLAARALGVPRVGLLLPEANLPHLLPDGELGRAMREGFLEVYAIRTVDEAIELAFGRAASVVHRAVADRLAAFKKLEDGER
ncbi:MAG TPA: ATP-dependent protease, partial [Oceanithermus sp.]|nr:ATP-dependent protease [Oceanithermus sp.]